MKPALELAVENYQRLRDEAAAALAHAQKELTSLRNTLSTLESYRDNLQARRRAPFGASQKAVTLQMDSHLSTRIDSAIQQQLRFIDQATKRANRKRDVLLDHQKRLKALEVIIRQQRAAYAESAARRERMEADEQAAIRHLNNIDNALIGPLHTQEPFHSDEIYSS